MESLKAEVKSFYVILTSNSLCHLELVERSVCILQVDLSISLALQSR